MRHISTQRVCSEAPYIVSMTVTFVKINYIYTLYHYQYYTV